MDNNGNIESKDATLILKYINNSNSEINIASAEYNYYKTVDLRDVVEMLSYILNASQKDNTLA